MRACVLAIVAVALLVNFAFFLVDNLFYQTVEQHFADPKVIASFLSVKFSPAGAVLDHADPGDRLPGRGERVAGPERRRQVTCGLLVAGALDFSSRRFATKEPYRLDGDRDTVLMGLLGAKIAD